MARNKETFVLTATAAILGLAISVLPASVHAEKIDPIQTPRGRVQQKADEIQTPRGRAEVQRADEIQAPRGRVQQKADETQAPRGYSATEAGKGDKARR